MSADARDQFAQLQALWAEQIVRSLAECGVRDAVISPGSRSTPLVLALSRTRRIRTTAVADERSAAFFALGQARVTGRPSALLCTSGSAAGHYLPAVMEASSSRIPLLVLSANRPLEREACEAPQTTDQRRLFGSHARGYFEIGVADGTERSLRAVARLTAQAVALAQSPSSGAVQVDVRARKPLQPSSDRVQELVPTPEIVQARTRAPRASVSDLAHRLSRAERPLLVAGPGPLHRTNLHSSILELETLGIPGAFELSSQLRSAGRLCGLTVLFESRAFREAVRPDLIVQLGSAPISGGWEPWIESLRAEHCDHVVISDGGFPDPVSTATLVLNGEMEPLLGQLARELSREVSSVPADDRTARQRWMELLARLARRAVVVGADPAADRLGVARAGEGEESQQPNERETTELAEIEVARAVLSGETTSLLAAGNSLAIRLAEAAALRGPWPTVWHQRGLNGIDGLVSGVAGSLDALHAQEGEPVAARLLIGDVSLLHDIGGLQLVRQQACAGLDIVVIDNGGGRIFDRLPVQSRGLSDEQARLFSTPPKVDLRQATSTFGLEFCEVVSASELRQVLGHREGRERARVICARVEPGREARNHRRWVRQLDQAVADELQSR